MNSMRYKEYLADKFEIVGKDEELLATVERDEGGQWRILPTPTWAAPAGFNFGPFSPEDEAFEELQAVPAEQS